MKNIKLKYFKSGDFIKISKAKLYREALREACAALVLDGRYSSYQAARNAMIKKATNNILNPSNSRELKKREV